LHAAGLHESCTALSIYLKYLEPPLAIGNW
jgi:hypothetical protein